MQLLFRSMGVVEGQWGPGRWNGLDLGRRGVVRCRPAGQLVLGRGCWYCQWQVRESRVESSKAG